MLKVNNISIKLNNKNIFSNISFTLPSKRIVALIGDNGSGKTTLLNILAHQIEPDHGKVEIVNETIVYLPQSIAFQDNETVKDFVGNIPFSNKYLFERIIEELELQNIDSDRLANSLSGGEKTKLYLAKIILTRDSYSILLLDEPTNNLDENGIAVLTNFLNNFKGSILYTSHDRNFIDNTADQLWELKEENIKIYGGNYSDYIEQKQIEEETYKRHYVAQEKKLQKMKDDISRIQSRTRYAEVKYGSNQPFIKGKIKKGAKLAVSREKKLNKITESEDYLDRPSEKRGYNFFFNGNVSEGKRILELKNISKSFGGRKIINNFSLAIYNNENILIQGKNGSGKTTLFKIITKEIQPDSGKIILGSNVNIGYFSQNITNLNFEDTVLNELMSTGLSKTESYKYATKFHLDTTQVHNKIKHISEGQKSLLSFAKLLRQDVQLLIFDEPTNHLEIKATEVIENAIHDYKGAILIASHDKYFLKYIKIDRTILMES